MARIQLKEGSGKL
ncbi:MAG: hypothetical protein IH984_04005 [Planctomycetes bacterium]|nr:hypothetical protein [Planctomycetota bacterium]